LATRRHKFQRQEAVVIQMPTLYHVIVYIYLICYRSYADFVLYPREITFKRKVGKDQLFGDEQPAPNLGNLATHYRQRHNGVPVPSDVQPGETRGVSASSAKIMADFLVEGKLNPAINSTQKNFLKVVAAWIIEDDLPFTTGETPGIRRPFATRYILPSDTTVRNTLAAMYIDMYNLVMSELAASSWLYIWIGI
jgi:hypothetical protein